MYLCSTLINKGQNKIYLTIKFKKMARTVETKIYSFEELSEAAQQKAIENNSNVLVDYGWWQDVYSLAQLVGLKITHSVTKNDPNYSIGIEFITSASNCGGLILANHEKDSETYQSALAFFKSEQNEDNEKEFLEALGEAYLTILTDEEDYRVSDEVISEWLKENKFGFFQDGSQWKY